MTAGQKAYREFLKTDFWKELSARKRAQVGKCERCRSTKSLQSHHKAYPKDWYETKLADLEVLCRKCHRKEHGLPERPSPWTMYREDNVFNAICHRCHCLNIRLAKQNSGGLRPRDEAFLDNALRLYPTTPEDGAVEYQVEYVRRVAKIIQESSKATLRSIKAMSEFIPVRLSKHAR